MIHEPKGNATCGKGGKRRAQGTRFDKMDLYAQDENYDKNGVEYRDFRHKEESKCRRLY